MARNFFRTRCRRIAARGLAVLGCMTALVVALPGSAQAVTLVYEPNASLFWTINGPAIMTVFQNGQCTEWAADKRPDILQEIVTGIVGQELANHQGENVPTMDARYWTQDAQQVGIPTGHKPRVGALIVFQPGVLGASQWGHIAYVVRVRHRSFTISEMNAPLPYHVSYRTLRMSAAHVPGVSFIY